MNLIGIEKLKGAKRLHRKYRITNDDNGIKPSVEGEWVEFGVFEFAMEFEDAFIDEVAEFRKKQHIEQSLIARSKNIVATSESEYEQGSKEWLKARMGLITASKTPFTVKGLPIPTFDDYVNEKIADAFIQENDGEVAETYKSEAMQAGNDLEIYAIEDYEALTGYKVDTHGFIVAKEMMLGMSPDGVVELDSGDRINIEVKSVFLKTYIGELHSNKVSHRYNTQMQVQMFMLDCDTTNLLVQCQQTTGQPLKMIVRIIQRDEEFISNMIETVALFEKEFKFRYEMLVGQIKTK